jgi:acetyl esterase/lipase
MNMRLIAGWVRVATYLNAKGWYTRTKAEPTSAQRAKHRIAMSTLGGREVWTVDPKQGTPRLTVIYLHGGAYVFPISPRHWRFIEGLVDHADVRVVAPLYGLAPASSYAAAWPFLVEVIQGLIIGGTDPKTIVIAGDSAGGGLALGLAHQLRDRDIEVGGLVLIAPWLDLAMTNPLAGQAQQRDPWLKIEALRTFAHQWAHGTPLNDPLVSTIYAPQHALPKTLVLCGDRDVFLPDNRAFVEEARAEGCDVRLVESAGALHVYPLLPTPEGRQGTAEILEFLRQV